MQGLITSTCPMTLAEAGRPVRLSPRASLGSAVQLKAAAVHVTGQQHSRSQQGL